MTYKYYKGREDELNNYLKVNNKVKLVSASYEGNDIYALVIAEDDSFDGKEIKGVKIFRGLQWELNKLQSESNKTYKVVYSEFQGMDVWSCLLSNMDLLTSNGKSSSHSEEDEDSDGTYDYDPETVVTVEIGNRLYIPKNEDLIIDGGDSLRD